MTVGLYLLRVFKSGIHIDDLKQMSIGMIHDIFTEQSNDSYEYPYIATQEDIDRL